LSIMGIFKRKSTNAPARTVARSGHTSQYIQDAKEIQVIRPIAGKRKDLGITFKSRMEANVYRWLLWKKNKGDIIDVRYEEKLFTFPSENTNTNKPPVNGYLPDLEVITKQGSHYVEVKGRLSERDIEKDRRFRKNFPGLKLYYIFPKQYNLIRKHYSSSVPNWEY